MFCCDKFVLPLLIHSEYMPFRVAYSWPLCSHVMSSTKPELPILLTIGFSHYLPTSIHTHTHPFNGPFFRDYPRVSRYQKGKTNLNFTEARDSEWQWHQLGHKQVCTSLQTDNHARTPPLSFLQAGCPSCRPINSVTALKANRPNSSHHNTLLAARHTGAFVDIRTCLLYGVAPW